MCERARERESARERERAGGRRRTGRRWRAMRGSGRGRRRGRGGTCRSRRRRAAAPAGRAPPARQPARARAGRPSLCVRNGYRAPRAARAVLPAAADVTDGAARPLPGCNGWGGAARARGRVPRGPQSACGDVRRRASSSICAPADAAGAKVSCLGAMGCGRMFMSVEEHLRFKMIYVVVDGTNSVWMVIVVGISQSNHQK